MLSVDAEDGKCQHQQQGDEPRYYGQDECTDASARCEGGACARQEVRNSLAYSPPACVPVLGSADVCECAARVQEFLQRRREDSVRVMTVFFISQSLASAICQS